MKWLKNILGGRAEAKTTSLQLDSLDAWLEERSSNVKFEESLPDIYRRIEELADAFDLDIKALASAEPDRATPPKLLRAGLAARGEVVKQMESLQEKMAPPRQRDIEAASAHHWALVKGLERTVTTFGRAQRYVAAIFPKEIESMNSDLTGMSRLLVELEEKIGKRRKELEEIWYSRELGQRVQQEVSRIGELESSIKRDEDHLAELQTSLSRGEAEQKRLAASDEGQRSEDLRKLLEQRQKELLRQEGEMLEMVAPLSKALTRIRKQEASNKLSLQNREIFEKLSTAPFEALDEDITGSLVELRSHMTSLGLRDRKKEKILEHLDILIEKKPLQALKSQHSDLLAEIKELEQGLTDSSHDAVQLREELSRMRRSMKSLETDLEKNRHDLAAAAEKEKRDMFELEERLGTLADGPIKVDLHPGGG